MPNEALETRSRRARRPALVAAAACWLAAGCVLLPTLGGAPPALEPAPGARREGLLDLRGAVHVHSFLSHDARRPVSVIAAAARETGVRWVAMTDHLSPLSVARGTRGERDGVLFTVGAEVSRGRGSILALGFGETPTATATTTARPPLVDLPAGAQETVGRIHEEGGLAFIGHCEKFKAWDEVQGFDGLEVYNLHADFLDEPRAALVLTALVSPPGALFRRARDLDPELLARWDALGRTRRVPGVGGCDAHANVNLLGSLGGTIGTHVESFRAVSTHALAPTCTAAAIQRALREGHTYIAFEIDGDATGFGLELYDAPPPGGAPGSPPAAIQGDEVGFRPGQRLRVVSPGGARVRLRVVRDGLLYAEAPGGLLEIGVDGPGVYRVEAYLDGDPFVLSNPIYVR